MWPINYFSMLTHIGVEGEVQIENHRKCLRTGFFYLVSLFNGISTFVGYLMPKPCL